MTASWLWARADLRRRWRSWVVLGILAGISVGLACAGLAGARRTAEAGPRYIRATHLPDAAVLANDPAFDGRKRAEVAHLPDVTGDYPFLVPFALQTGQPKGLETGLVPTAERSTWLAGVVIEGREPNPARADEIIVNENVRKRFGLDIGSTMTLVQHTPGPNDGLPPALIPKGNANINQTMRVVGISKSTDNELDSMPSVGFYRKYRRNLVGVTNQFIDLKPGADAYLRFENGVQKVLGHPVNVVDAEELFGIRKSADIANIERGGLLLFAFAVLLGAGALVGQALVRAVSAGAADLPTWRAIGADRRIVVRALILPTVVTAAVGAVTVVLVAIGLSSRFPIGATRKIELTPGVHADWPVLLIGAVGLIVAVLAAAWVTAEVRIRRQVRERSQLSALARLATSVDLPPSLLIGSRLAVEPGRGRRAVPVRSAMIGAIVGVLGVVGCLTFRAGLSDTINDPARSGIKWDYTLASTSPVTKDVRGVIAEDAAVSSALDAFWARAVRMNGRPIPTFGTERFKGRMDLVIVDGRAPEGLGEMALAPTTMKALHAHIGQTIKVGIGSGHSMRVVGSAFMPATSHTDYDESAWMSRKALERALPPVDERDPEYAEDWVLVRFRPGADVQAAQKRLSASFGGGSEKFKAPAELPVAVGTLKDLRSLPFWLAIFFGLLADRDGGAHARHHRAAAAARPRRPAGHRLHATRRSGRHRLAGDADCDHGPRGGDPARDRDRSPAVEAAGRELPGGVRPPAGAVCRAPRRPRGDRRGEPHRGGSGARRDAHPARSSPAHGVAKERGAPQRPSDRAQWRAWMPRGELSVTFLKARATSTCSMVKSSAWRIIGCVLAKS